MNIVWTIAGSDSGGGAGLQADLAAFNDFKVHGCTVISLLTAQNSVGVDRVGYIDGLMLNAQINALKRDLPAKAIKLSLLGTEENIKTVSNFLHDYTGHVIVDPVFVATTGASLADESLANAYRRYIYPYLTLITPNVKETKLLTGITLNTPENYKLAAQKLLAMGCKAVLLKSGDASWSPELSSDYYADDRENFWINHYRVNTKHTHGTGCTLSAAICASLALGYSLKESIILAKAYVQAGLKAAVGLGMGPGPLAHNGFPADSLDFPWVTQTPQDLSVAFPTCEQPLDLYPLVNNLEDLKLCIDMGFNTVQLRAENPDVAQAVSMAKNTKTQLFINNHWQQAIAAGAYGVHLGQDDLLTADIATIHKAGLRLGISSNGLFSLAKAYAYNPSYLAAGPIFQTNSKPNAAQPIGLEKLHTMENLSPKPLCAIGGIKQNDFEKIKALGCEGVAFIEVLSEFKKHASLVS